MEAAIKSTQKEDEKLLFIHRYSQVDQIFFGSLHPIITEQVLMKNVDFGQLIHIEVKYRSNQTTNYGFATVLDSKKPIEKLIEKRSYVVNGVRIEFKPKLNKLNKKNNIQQNAPAIAFRPSGKNLSTSAIANQFSARDNAPPATGAPGAPHYARNMNPPRGYPQHFDAYDDYKFERELYLKYLAERAHRRRAAAYGHGNPQMYDSVFTRQRYF